LLPLNVKESHYRSGSYSPVSHRATRNLPENTIDVRGRQDKNAPVAGHCLDGARSPCSTSSRRIKYQMSEIAVIANQKRILKNQKEIIANQTKIKSNQEAIKRNQATILKNQGSLNTIIKNQKQILALLKK
jgi:hypothetical protein